MQWVLSQNFDMTTVEIPRHDILDLICAADTYGYGNDVLLCTFAEWLKVLPDDEIQQFAKRLGESEGYGEEDEESAIECLADFKKKYSTIGILK